MNKKVVYISGTRADFNLMLKPLLELRKHVNLIIIVTGMHLSKKWGYTTEEIEKYDFATQKCDIKLEIDDLYSMVKYFGLEITKLSDIINEVNPDLIFVEGDRGEALAGAIIGAHLNIPVVHHGGGDISDSIDNKIRNAITIFSDFHLTGNIESYNRLIKIGIPEKCVFNVGEPGLDDIIANNYTPKDQIYKKFEINPDEKLLLLIFHPNTKEYYSIEQQITTILKVIKELKIPTIGLYANADAGGNIINNSLDEYKKHTSHLRLFKHFNREDFYGLMNVCSSMIGNSSSGITELPSFKKPFICIGTRQKGRLKTDNVIEVNYDKKEIINAIHQALYDIDFIKKLENLTNPYGDGKSYLKISNNICRILKELG